MRRKASVTYTLAACNSDVGGRDAHVCDDGTHTTTRQTLPTVRYQEQIKEALSRSRKVRLHKPRRAIILSVVIILRAHGCTNLENANITSLDSAHSPRQGKDTRTGFNGDCISPGTSLRPPGRKINKGIRKRQFGGGPKLMLHPYLKWGFPHQKRTGCHNQLHYADTTTVKEQMVKRIRRSSPKHLKEGIQLDCGRPATAT